MEKTKKDIKDYLSFTFENFLQDDFFVKSVLKPTEESDLFWKSFKKEYKGDLDGFYNAAKCINDLNKNLLSDHNVQNIWNDIQISNRKQPAKIRIIYISGLVTAASIALLLFFRFFFSPVQEINEQGIKTFAYENILTEEQTETQLILSDNKVISLPEKESFILYDSASIKVSSRETLKNEISKNETSEFNQLIIPKGKRSFLTLSDGTRIWVNSGTRVVFPVEFKAGNREIFVDGEIYLDVQPDKHRPFIVRTSDIDIQVLGTEFNVQAYSSDNQKRVVLRSGSVKISNTDDKEIFLRPDEMYELNDEKEVIAQVDVNTYTSWIDGVYICEKERLDVIITRLSRYYGKEMIVDKKAAGLRCNGKLDLKDNLDDVMAIIKYIAPVNCTYEKDKYIITYKP
ncbi:MAG: FecR domain-containing protein [Bacteroidales bacterium]|jgi:hypothetical protein|nr:FecR domain-containing protein [Bacteroidales bacterium]